MSAELEEFISLIWASYRTEGASIEGITRVVLDEKIKSLLLIDEAMCNNLMEGLNKYWDETIWHTTIKQEVDKLRKLRGELK